MSQSAGPADHARNRRRATVSRLLRSAVISFCALLLLAGGFYAYWRMQPPMAGGPSAGPTTFPSTAPSAYTQNLVGPGQRPWVNNYEGGKLSSQFNARQFTPIGNGNFDVDHPVWVFYLNDGQFLMLTGESAVVHEDTAGDSGASAVSANPHAPAGGDTLDGATISTSFMQMPSSGTLQHVNAGLYPSKAATRPTLTLTTNNLAFDHDTLRLYTQQYTDASGQLITADRVPVMVRGDDYDFDGQGLSMHWDDRDQRLQLLEIAHGQDLVIKHPSKLSTPMAPASAARADAPPPAALVDASPRGAALALQPTAARSSVATPKPATPPVVYQAVFNDLVRIWQGDQQMATADTMAVDFLSGGKKPEPEASKPTHATPPPPDNEPLETQPQAPAAATRAAAGAAPATQPSEAALAANEPITIRWTGKLRLTPIDTPPILPLAGGQAVVRLVGSPVVLTPKGSTVHAAAVVYRSGDSAGRLENSPAVPQFEVKQDSGLVFHSESANYDPAKEIATITGRSDLSVPLQGDQAQKMTASWSDIARFHVIAANGTPQSVDHADMLGDVKVNHPQFNLKSGELALDLAPVEAPAHQPSDASAAPSVTLKRMTAIGNVICRLPIAYGYDRGIDSQRLVVDTQPGPNGQVIPHFVTADGSARAFDSQAQDELRAQHLYAVLVPQAPAATASAPADANAPAADVSQSVQLQSLDANGNVHANRKGGATADADQLHLTTPGGKEHVELRGSAGKYAAVSDGVHGTLSGPIILIDPDRSAVAVNGPGVMHADRRTSATQPAQPVDVTWTHDLAVDNTANTVDVHGKLVANMVDANGDHNQIVGDSAHADLMDAPPATQPAGSAVNTPETTTITTATTHPSNPQKQVKDLAIRGHVIATSLLLGPDQATVYRRGVMDAEEMDYDALAARGLVPGPGRLLVEDHRPQGAANGAADATGNSRGTMAIQWAKSLLYDENQNHIVFTGDVRTVFRQDQKNAQKMYLNCNTLTADMESTPAATPLQVPAPTTNPSAQRMQLKLVTAAGAAHFIAKDLDMIASTIQYDPKTSLLTATGTPAEPGQFLDANGQSAGTFQKVIYDTANEKIVSEEGLTGSVNR